MRVAQAGVALPRETQSCTTQLNRLDRGRPRPHALKDRFDMMTVTKPKLATDADRAIGSRIAAIRAAQGLSQTTLGHAIGVSFQQVQKYEKGRNRVGASRLQMIADLLKVPVETFFADKVSADAGAVPVQTYFDDPAIMELVAAFRSIPDQTTRSGILSIVKAAAALRNAGTKS
ncbi:helix-turn-helix domain-containing protein [Methylobacterium sp. J-072]|uniref:helix-turn-helix domain-containing protein n=1 Tax=Methylobacterium sp. J-072 TaxID=2836651 RepID=UPI001FB8774F|nr:helix-turn-helix transcriptional regulator [Methylobacterium sp. J-072]MCJ2095328.1 helix-turn-helix domain-containing protein [Methylobacterium sp. J-072]